MSTIVITTVPAFTCRPRPSRSARMPANRYHLPQERRTGAKPMSVSPGRPEPVLTHPVTIDGHIGYTLYQPRVFPQPSAPTTAPVLTSGRPCPTGYPPTMPRVGRVRLRHGAKQTPPGEGATTRKRIIKWEYRVRESVLTHLRK